MTREERKAIGMKAVEFVNKNFSFKQFGASWDRIMKDVHERHGSWETRKGYTSWTVKEF